MENIKVHIVDKGRKYFYMRYRCPITNKEETRSTCEIKRKEAEKVAAKWEAQLQEGRYQRTAFMPWEEFRESYTTNCLDALAGSTIVNYNSTLNKFERFCKPKKVGDLTTVKVTGFVSYLRDDSVSEASIARHLRVLKLVSRWAHKQGLLASLPDITMPKRARGAKVMRGRPITLEEFERILTKVNGGDSEVWSFFLRGLWTSGLRIGEAVNLSWHDEPGTIVVDMASRYPMLRIPAEAEKGNRDRIHPMTPDFAKLLYTVPETERFGKVFKVIGNLTEIGRKVSNLGKAAGVVVDENNGKKKFASAHDLRRSFGSRWSRKVMPAELRELMRHASLQTTMAYYVGDNAEATAKALWEAEGDTLGDTNTKTTTDSLANRRLKSL